MNLRLKIITLLCILFSLSSFAQKESKIYDKKGRLIADTSFSISHLQLKRFIKIEDTLLQQLTKNIHYPEVEREAQLGDSLIIVSFIINENDSITSVKLETQKTKYAPGLFREIMRVLTKKVSYFANYNSKGIGNKKYYLAFKFRELFTTKSKSSESVIISNGIIIKIFTLCLVKPEGRMNNTFVH